MVRTKTDPGTFDLTVEDEPMQLREWGTARTFSLPPNRADDWLIGSAPECWLQLQDHERFVSRHHAVLRRIESNWSISDSASKNGLWVDGQRVSASLLVPGIEIGIGRLRLLVESPAIVRRRELLARLLGWRPERQVSVDRALRATRDLAAFRAPMWLSGVDDLSAIGRRLHRELHGDARPFVATSFRSLSKNVDKTLRSVAGGTLCVALKASDERQMHDVIGDRELGCSLIVCTTEPLRVTAIVVPPLSTRVDDLERLIKEYALDAIELLSAKPSSFVEQDRRWLLDRRPSSLREIETATYRMIAIREFGGVTSAAARLGLTHSALSRWVARRVVRARRS